jgi:nitroreductase
MDVFNAIRTRRTVRDFTDAPVSDAVLHKILQAARWAPSSSNTQPWHFIAIRDRDTIAELGRICTQGAFIGQAPLAIAVVMGETRRPQLDAGRALQQMELVAWSEGLGTCFVGIRGEQQTEVKALLDIPEDMELVTVLPFGYRVMRPAGTGTPRKPMSEIAHGERFGQALTFAD